MNDKTIRIILGITGVSGRYLNKNNRSVCFGVDHTEVMFVRGFPPNEMFLRFACIPGLNSFCLGAGAIGSIYLEP